jgi:hypothetical protein
MANAFASLKTGDPFFFDSTEYLASGSLRLRADDGTQWAEWLLVPRRMRAADAIRERRHRWLSREDGKGLHVWSPVELPGGFSPDALAEASSFRLADRDYRVVERYAFDVVEAHGDLGGNAAGGRFQAVDLRGGQKMLCIDWNASGTEALLGRHIGDHDLLRWSKEAGGGLASRIRTQHPASNKLANQAIHAGSALDRKGQGIGGWTVGAIIIALIVALQSCDDDRDCRQQYNAATGTYDTVCERGLRSSGGRSHGGWGGK